ncbi:MAG: heavy metal translocating P-type ATPase, partial [Neisseriaceae bacterium]|nr:heavy metal translocating P-type ATPase [Neisseriaceae bacterium]
LIACPCALVLSTPAAIASSLATATRQGILIKGGHALETIGHVSMIAFDKTGTLTEGAPKVTDILAYDNYNNQEVLTLAAGIESGSNHPLAQAIITKARAENIVIPSVKNASTTAGKAVHANINGKNFSIGSPSYIEQMFELNSQHKKNITDLENEGKTVTVLFDKDKSKILGLIALRDDPRQDASQGVSQLNNLDVRSIMLTGDNSRTANAISDQLGIEYQAELLPQEKLDFINQLKIETKIAMVGDGINDAPALASADVGISMGVGTDIALETADIALLKNRVTDVAYLIALSRATMKNIYQNVSFALGLKGLFLITSIFGITGLWIAVLADTGATAIVTLNALHLLRFKYHPSRKL